MRRWIWTSLTGRKPSGQTFEMIDLTRSVRFPIGCVTASR